MFVWCLMLVLQDHSLFETSVRGKVMLTNTEFYLVDFSTYAKKQGYEELENPKMIDKNKCMEDK